ncbi:MAG TPA: daunorubicin/doxorubicin resistance ABC transporter ATP-binding protein DrrA, partial [Ilumatobacteraceae bacterium]|nr:daunorubicin/doxorubicin resistance ABC transporter ATP-binding protein DrrA [Ilumatobacteraceae bacterium]
ANSVAVGLGGGPQMADAVRRLDERGIAVTDIGLRRPTLDDVFLTLTGHRAEDNPAPEGAVA